MKKFRLVLLALLCACPLLLNGQAEGLSFDVFTTEEGLSRSSVRGIVQDSRGYIWIGTEYGLNRYDGYDFQVFLNNPADSSSLGDNGCRTMAVDSKGQLWVGTNASGVSVYDPNTDAFWHIKAKAGDKPGNGLADNQVDHILEAQDGTIWIATINGITRYFPDTKKLKTFYAMPDKPKRLPDRYTKYLCQTSKGDLWVAHDKGISQIHVVSDDSVWFENYLYEEGRENWLPSKYVKKIIADAQGNLWIASDGGLSLFDKGARHFITYSHKPGDPTSLSNNYVKTIAFDAEGNIWVGADAGVSIFDTHRRVFQNYGHDVNNPKSLSNDYVKVLFLDNAGAMWVGTDAGLNVYDKLKHPFQLFRHELGNAKSLSSSYIYAMAEAPNGLVWVGTNRGLNLLNRATGESQVFTHRLGDAKSIGSDIVKDLLYAKDGTLWIATDNGLSKWLGNGAFKTYRSDPNNPNSIRNNSVVALAEDAQGMLWIGSWGAGLHVFDPKTETFTPIRDQDWNGIRVSGDQTQALCVDSQNRLWIGSPTSVKMLDMNAWELSDISGQTPVNGMLANSNINAIYEDRKGRIWIGAGHGAVCFDPKKNAYTNYTTEHGLPSNIVYAIMEDMAGYIWLSSDKGLSRLEMGSVNVRTFDTSDGLQGNEFVYGAVFQNASGEIYFGGTKGLNVFNPTALQNNTHKPPVYITDLWIRSEHIRPGPNSILDKPISQKRRLVLTYKDNLLKIAFVALNYRNPQRNRYKYRMDGVHDDWVETSAERRDVTFTNLNPGKYTFRLKASNNDGVWNEEGAALEIIITPPWYDEPLVRFIFFVSTIALIYGIFRVRTSMLENQKKLLEEQVKERTEDLSKANKELQAQKEAIVVQNEELHQQAEEIAAQRDRIEDQHKALEATYQDIRIVSEVGKDITGSLSLDKIFEEVYKDVNLLMDAPTFAIGVTNTTGDTISFLEIDGEGREKSYSQDSLSDNSRLSVQCYNSGRPIVINHFSVEMKNYRIDGGTDVNESVIYLPLISKGKKVGVFTVQSPKQDAYQARHLTILEMLASYVATALDNTDAYEVIKNKNKLITDSIRYAQTIQQAILPSPERLQEAFSDHFILFRPKDIVSGDFYWAISVVDAETRLRKQYLACVDCTGHGVPGAFMSMIGARILNEVVVEKGLRSPADILELVNKSIQVALKQEVQQDGNRREVNNDGMDISICMFEKIGLGKTRMTFAGAKSAIYYSKGNGEIQRIVGDKRSIGGLQRNNDPFTNHELLLEAGDKVYLATDGITDQNNHESEKFGRQRFLDALSSTIAEKMDVQQQALANALDSFQQDAEQRDDITVIGVAI